MGVNFVPSHPNIRKRFLVHKIKFERILIIWTDFEITCILTDFKRYFYQRYLHNSVINGVVHANFSKR